MKYSNKNTIKELKTLLQLFRDAVNSSLSPKTFFVTEVRRCPRPPKKWPVHPSRGSRVYRWDDQATTVHIQNKCPITYPSKGNYKLGPIRLASRISNM